MTTWPENGSLTLIAGFDSAIDEHPHRHGDDEAGDVAGVVEVERAAHVGRHCRRWPAVADDAGPAQESRRPAGVPPVVDVNAALDDQGTRTVPVVVPVAFAYVAEVSELKIGPYMFLTPE